MLLCSAGLTGGLAAPLLAAGAGAIIGGAGAAALGSAAGVAIIGSLFGVAGAGLGGEGCTHAHTHFVPPVRTRTHPHTAK